MWEAPLTELRRVIFTATGRKLTTEEVGAAQRATAALEGLFGELERQARDMALDAMAQAGSAARKVDTLKAAVLAALEHECEDGYGHY